MADNGGGAAAAGVVLGIIMAAQLGNWGSDNPDSDVSVGRDRTESSGIDDGAPSDGSSGIPGVGLDVPGVIRTTGRDGTTVALTFSSGPDPRNTPQTLDILADRGVDATFCVIGAAAQEHPELVGRIAAEGHTLCNQTASADFGLYGQDDATIRLEISGGTASIQAAAPNAPVPFFRAPGGNFSAELVDAAEDAGQASLGWNVDPRDWETLDAAAIRDAVVDNVQPGSIVILHDGVDDMNQTVDALPGIIDDLQAAGYTFVIPAS
ncbi:MAG: polysaccharide deacetylase family protein [Jiangellaceae bacterium]|nr:polysaccharide deacetylase family protein [Jiangellaceae bacterium]